MRRCSLSAAIETAHGLRRGRETVRLTALLKEGWFANGRYTDARAAYQLAEEAATRLEDEAALGQIWLAWGEACFEQSDYLNANIKLSSAVKVFLANKLYSNVTKAYSTLSLIAIYQSNYDEAQELVNETILLLLRFESSFERILLRHRQIAILYYQGKYVEAWRVGHEVLKDIDGAIEFVNLFDIYILMSNIHAELMKMGVFASQEDGLAFAIKAMDIGKSIGNQNKIAVAHYSLVRAHIAKNDFKSAKNEAYIALKLMEKFGDIRSKASLLQLLCEIDYGLERLESSLMFANQCLTLYVQLDLKYNVAVSYGNIGAITFAQKKFHDAKKAWEAALSIAESIAHDVLIESFSSRLKMLQHELSST